MVKKIMLLCSVSSVSGPA